MAAPKVGDTVVFKTSRQGYHEGKVEKLNVQPGDAVAAHSDNIYWPGSIVKSVTPDVIEVEIIESGRALSIPHEKAVKVSPASAAELKKFADEMGFLKRAKATRPKAPAGYKPKPGDRVVAEWSASAWWPGEVISVSGEKVKLNWPASFPDSELPLEKVMPFPKAESATVLPKQGDFVLVKPASDKSQWQYAQVTSVSGQTAEVKLADGKTRSIKADEYIALS